jgi:hypothetical protein
MRSLTNVRGGGRAPALLSLLTAFACTGGDDVTAPSAADLTITAAAGGSRVISVLPAQNDFGTVALGGTSTRTITVTNTGTKVTSGLVVSITGAAATDYSIAAGDDGCTGRSLALSGKNKSCAIKVTFAPASAGTRNATLTAAVAQPKTSVSVGLVGTAPAQFHTLSGTVFTDADLDGLMGDTEAGVGGVVVRMVNGSGTTLASRTTRTDGTYVMEFLPTTSGTLAIVAPSGMLITTPNAQPRTVTVTGDQTGLDFGLSSSTIVGTVRYGSGGQCTESSEVASGIHMMLSTYDPTPEGPSAFSISTTDAAGAYRFLARPNVGDQGYTLLPTLPDGYMITGGYTPFTLTAAAPTTVRDYCLLPAL